MLIVLIGKTASGKTSIRKKLGWHEIVTYTSRPIRKKEQQGVDYHFISLEEFEQKKKEGFFMEYKCYHTTQGDWYYGSPINEIEKSEENNSVIILTPDGYRDFKSICPEIPHKSFYIYANLKTIKERLLKRGDSKEEADRRITHDNEDFKGIENEVDKIIYNNNDNDLGKVVERILQFVNGGD